MCEFCHKHGEGKKWYLQAQNYAEDRLRCCAGTIAANLDGARG